MPRVVARESQIHYPILRSHGLGAAYISTVKSQYRELGCSRTGPRGEDRLAVRARAECRGVGADAYIRKPINVGELLTAVERALEARHRTPPVPAPAPRHVSDDAGTGERTPEQFLETFEYFHHEPDS